MLSDIWKALKDDDRKVEENNALVIPVKAVTMYTDKGSKWYLYPPCSQTQKLQQGTIKESTYGSPKEEKPKESVNRHPVLYVAELM